MRNTLRTIAISTLIVGMNNANAFTAALGVHGGTMGPGLDVSVPIIDQKLTGRAGFNYLDYSTSGSTSGVDYDVDLNLHNAFALFDYHPFGGAFRLTAGGYYNDNSVDLKGKANSGNTFDIGNSTYTGTQIGTLNGKVDFNTFSPYVGLGFGNAVGKGSPFTFNVDIGAIYQGSPDVKLSANGPIASNPTFQADLAREVKDLNDKGDSYKFYPVVQVGLSYRF